MKRILLCALTVIVFFTMPIDAYANVVSKAAAAAAKLIGKKAPKIVKPVAKELGRKPSALPPTGAIVNGTRRIYSQYQSVKKSSPCWRCDGSGSVLCEICDGRGCRVVWTQDGPIRVACPTVVYCPICEGTGRCE